MLEEKGKEILYALGMGKRILHGRHGEKRELNPAAQACVILVSLVFARIFQEAVYEKGDYIFWAISTKEIKD